MDKISGDWFTTQVDRCFERGIYGMGIRLYCASKSGYTHIKGISYCRDNNELTVETAQEKSKKMVLSSEPNIELFRSSIGNKWKEWDAKYGEKIEEDRCDYRPWAHDSLSSLAAELKLHDGEITYSKP